MENVGQTFRFAIENNVKAILSELPENVALVAATKARTVAEILEAIHAGVKIIGENYVQEAERKYEQISGARGATSTSANYELSTMALNQVQGELIKWHFIGHLQKNKVKKIVKFVDLIETVDSVEIAQEIDKRCKAINKVLPVLIEINSGREPQKSGIFPEQAEEFIKEIATIRRACCQNIKVMGLMTMGPLAGNPEDARPYFKETKKVFDKIKIRVGRGNCPSPNVEMKFLSMGMTNSYKIAIEEGANIVRIGTKIFGERPTGRDFIVPIRETGARSF